MGVASEHPLEGHVKQHKKADFDVNKIRRFLEPGPVVLVSSAHGGDRDIMTMGWHMILNDGPSLVHLGPEPQPRAD